MWYIYLATDFEIEFTTALIRGSVDAFVGLSSGTSTPSSRADFSPALTLEGAYASFYVLTFSVNSSSVVNSTLSASDLSFST
jgi:hypothetical protein